jgi:4-hydroxybenzoate polyprenyltransferase
LPALVVTGGFVGMAAAYPLAKRYTNYPQFVLGMCFNSGIIIGALASNPSAFMPVMIPMYISGIAWTMIYDTVYAYQVQLF